MSIVVDDQSVEQDLSLEFVYYGPGQKRLWIQDKTSWFPSIGWCPHLYFGGGECRSCSLALD